MTQVLFAFKHPDGKPVVNAAFTIQLRRSGLGVSADGVVVPASYTYKTGVDGTLLVDLVPSTTAYMMVMVDPGADECGGGVRYKFYVPESNEVLNAQDLYLAPPPNSEPWDETAIRMLTDAKEAAVTAAVTAVDAAKRAEDASQGIDDDADRAERARDSAEAYSIDALAARDETGRDRVAAQQAALEAGNAADAKVKVLEDTLMSADGSDELGYSFKSSHSVKRVLSEKLKTEVRSLLDFMPQNQKSSIIAGNSLWDSSEYINYALVECPGIITVPAGCRFAQASPIKLQRGSVLRGGSPFDTRPGYGSKFYLLNGSNCEQLITPYAQDGKSQTHFMGLDDLIFDGNKLGQDREVDGGVIKWWGTFVGAWFNRVFLYNQLGTALDIRGGSDVELHHLWIAGCATENGYALDTNAELSGNTLGGLLQCSNLYVENTSVNKNFDSKTNEEYRGKNIRFRRLVSLSATEIHTEGAANGVDLDKNREVNIGKITSYNIGSSNTTEGALVRHVGEMSQSVNIGPMSTSGATNAPFIVRKAAGLLNSNAVPEVKNLTLPFINRYTSQADNLYPFSKMSRAAYSNMLAVERIATYAEVGVRLYWGDADDSVTATSRFLERGLGPVIGSSINQPGGALKDFVSIRSSGGSGDSITLSDPLKPGSRSTAAAIQAGMIYLGVSLPGLGSGPVLQRTTGLAAAADGIATVVRGNGAPAGGADYIGQFYVDMATPPPRKVYMGTGFTGAVSDWSPLN